MGQNGESNGKEHGDLNGNWDHTPDARVGSVENQMQIKCKMESARYHIYIGVRVARV